ncbi:MAG: flippase [Terriglobales bacterium]|jgi:O-antigen/teichoic acid export membrane protein
MRDSDTPLLPVAGNADDHAGFHAHVGRISRQSAIFFAGTIFTAAASYVFKIYVARSLGARALGIYALGMTATGLLGVFAGGGLPQTATRFVAAYSATQQYEKLRVFLWRGAGILALLQIAACVVLMATKNFVAHRIYHTPEIALYMSFFVGLMFLGAFTSFLSEVLAGYRDVTRRTIIVNFIGTPLLIICVVIFLALGFGLWGYLLGQLITSSLVLALLAAVVWKLTPAPTPSAPRPPAQTGNEIAFYALTLLGSQTLTFFLAQSDRIALGIFTTATDVGVYALALGLSAFVSIALQSVNQIFTPTISELHAKGDGATLSRLYRTLTKWTLALTIPLAFSVMIFSYPLMRLFGPDFGRGWIVLAIVVAGELANCGVGSVGMILLMTGKESRLLRIQMWLTPLVILLNFVFIPIWGLVGAAIVASLTNVMTNLWCLFEVERSLTIHPSMRGYLQLFPASLLTVAFIIALRFFTRGTHAQLVIIAGTILAAYAIFAATFAILSTDEDDRFILRTAWARLRQLGQT